LKNWDIIFLNLTFMGPCIVNIFLSMTNKMQRCIILFITVNALHVSSRKTAWNMYSVDNNKEYYTTLHLVGHA
jgi:hypothetical protein